MACGADDAPNRKRDAKTTTRGDMVTRSTLHTARGSGGACNDDDTPLRPRLLPPPSATCVLCAVLLFFACGCLALEDSPDPPAASSATASASEPEALLKLRRASRALGELVVQRARRAAAALAVPNAAPYVFAPAALAGIGAAFPSLLPNLRVPGGTSPRRWGGLAAVLLLVAWASVSLPRLVKGGKAHGAPEPLRLDAFGEAIARLTSGPSARHTGVASALVDWARDWEESSLTAGGGAHKLLLFGEAGGALPARVAEAMRTELMPRGPGHVIDLDVEAECASQGCASRIEKHLAASSGAGKRALVVLRHVDACATDQMYDEVVGVIERYLDETPAVQTTAHGEVIKSRSAFLLIASCLTKSRCEQIEASGAASAPHELVAGGDVERLWPRERFSSEVNTAKRALINRLGTDLAVMCG